MTIWEYVIGDGRTAAEMLMMMAARANELWRINGLDVSNPLVVDESSRAAGAPISQTIATAGGVTTVTLQP